MTKIIVQNFTIDPGSTQAGADLISDTISDSEGCENQLEVSDTVRCSLDIYSFVTFLSLIFACALFTVLALWPSNVVALSLANSNWIWTDSASGYMTVNPFVTADFRRDFTSPAGKTAVSSQIIITADNKYTLFVNGEYIGYGNDWTISQQYYVRLNPGYNVFAVAVENEELAPGNTTPNPAAFIAAIQINYSDGTTDTIVTDSQWLGNVATPGFQSIRYNDAGWRNAFVAGPVNSSPWRTPTGPNGPSSLSIAGSYWVWTNEVPPNSPLSVAPVGSRAFRKTIDVAGGLASIGWVYNCHYSTIAFKVPSRPQSQCTFQPSIEEILAWQAWLGCCREGPVAENGRTRLSDMVSSMHFGSGHHPGNDPN